MSRRADKGTAGFTLLEVTLAVGIFAAVIGVTAQALMSFYMTLDLQEQRIEAINSCRSVLSAIREKRVEMKDNFPDGLVEWVEEQNSGGWSTYSNAEAETGVLNDFVVEVSCTNLAGENPGANDVPIQVLAKATWKDGRGREIEVSVASALSDE